MRESARQRGVDKIVALTRQPTDLVSLWRECTEVIAAAVPHYQTPCWYTVDPASLLVTSHFQHGLPEFPAEWLASEYRDQEVNQIADVIRSESGLSTLHEATGGDPSTTVRWQRNMSLGGDQELVMRLRARSGGVWGALGLYREPGRPHFDEAEKSFLQEIAPHLAEGARRALLVGEAKDPEAAAHPARLFPLLMSAYGLTAREQDVTRLVLQGNSTTEIAQELTVSTHTVQQHLKSIFDKTGVRSRRDLVARVFFAHYEPRFRDNERRVLDGKPVRGHPYPTATRPV